MDGLFIYFLLFGGGVKGISLLREELSGPRMQSALVQHFGFPPLSAKVSATFFQGEQWPKTWLLAVYSG